MAEDREVRQFDTIELRVEKREDEAPKIVGHAAVFNSPASIGSVAWGWRETVAPGAFADTIEVDDVRALFNHDPNYVLGRNVAGTLELSEDDKGLLYTIIPPETQAARDLMASIERGDITGSSFGFSVLEDKWKFSEDENEWDERELVKLKLYDVSPVTFPAYEDTDVYKRGLEVAKRKHKEQRDMFEAGAAEGETRQDEEDWRAIPYSRHGDETIQAEDTPWNGPEQKTDATVEQLADMALFEDKEALDVKSGYKGHHHDHVNNSVNWNGVRSAMGVLRGARGGFKGVSNAELSKGYDHLKKHYAQFDKEPPENPYRSDTPNIDQMRMRERLSS